MTCDCEQCWYCEQTLWGKHEHDHVWPKRSGGMTTVPICTPCHNMKDRTKLEDWPLDVAVNALLSVPPGPARILLAKLYGLALDLPELLAMLDKQTAELRALR